MTSLTRGMWAPANQLRLVGRQQIYVFRGFFELNRICKHASTHAVFYMYTHFTKPCACVKGKEQCIHIVYV